MGRGWEEWAGKRRASRDDGGRGKKRRRFGRRTRMVAAVEWESGKEEDVLSF